ncbi:unnamed protein product [Nesidiocoris tenuis]|uniref:DML1/Misato tubulin domain-containing protein n=1 Tax=Nesidiocoris tenuis TaxID=355587 RepID=A0A6H5GGI5_9HEMI|nr:unnamed protein product [Nesidiocoris tenuis]
MFGAKEKKRTGSLQHTVSDDINHDVLFREGTSEAGAFTYTPRLVVVDFEQSLHSLSKTGRNFVKAPQLEDVKRAVQTDEVEVLRSEPAPEKNEYHEDVAKQSEAADKEDSMDVDVLLKTKYNLNPNSWSEVLTLDLHPRSLTTIPTQLTSGLELAKTTAAVGGQIWKSPSFADEFEDNVRFQLESCDIVQGFHVLTECENMYAGMASACLEHIRDECGKKSIITVPIFSLHDYEMNAIEGRKQLFTSLVNTALNFSRSNDLSDLVAPFSTRVNLWTDGATFNDCNNLSFDGSSAYHSSSIMAAGLELFSTPYRLKRLLDVKMSNIVALLGLPGRKFVGGGVVFPFPERKIDYDILELLKRHKYSSLCPFVDLENTLDVQAVTLKGFRHEMFPTSPALFVSPMNVRIPRTFPDIISSEHDVSNSALYYGRLREVTALSGLCNSREMKTLFETLVGKLRAHNYHKLPGFISNDLEAAELTDSLETLDDIGASYDISMFL